MRSSVCRREATAGVTTFLAMSYIVVVNPAILSNAGMPSEDLFFATCVSAVAAGGRTYRTGLMTAFLFLATLPLFPLVAAIPAVATTPALVMVDALMFGEAAKIDWNDSAKAPAALATILIMPATYNISNGIGAGFILYVVTHLSKKRLRSINPLTLVIAALFVVYFIFKLDG